jgi:hypothetical protein
MAIIAQRVESTNGNDAGGCTLTFEGQITADTTGTLQVTLPTAAVAGALRQALEKPKRSGASHIIMRRRRR